MLYNDICERGRPCVTCPAGYPPLCRVLIDPQAEEFGRFQHLLAQNFEIFEPHRNVYLRNAKSDDIYILCDGWAFTFLQTADGRRQIISFLVGGDFFSPGILFEETSALSLRTLTKALFCRMKRADVRKKVVSSDETLDVIGKIGTANERAKNELLLDLGRRNADERIAHLMLTLTERLDRLGTAQGGVYPFPLRQRDMADATGLTPVHVGRTIAKFRDAGLIELSAGFLKILNRAELGRIGCID